MEATLIAEARSSAQLSLRELAKRAGTSHSTLVAYEHARNSPSIETMMRIIRAAGYELDVRLERRIRLANGLDRGDELEMALELAAQFPARHSRTLQAPKFRIQPVE